MSRYPFNVNAEEERAVELTSSFAVLDDAQFDEMRRLQGFYHREARKCEAAKAYLPGCVMLGAALEAGLMAMVHCFPDEVAGCNTAPRLKDKVKPLVQWKLSELLRAAKELGWLPTGLQLWEDWDARRADIGEHCEVVRRLRNLVHPAGYLEEHRGRRVTSKYLAHIRGFRRSTAAPPA